MLDQYK